ncbi:phasin family protein, partial [Paraburkholderia sp. SIMBA_053]
AVEQSADFGLRTLPGIFGLQNEAFERLQKLTHLNLAALKAMLEEGQAALSPQQSGLPPAFGAVALSQRFVEHTLSYSTHVREIDSQFMAAVTRAGEDLRNQ